MARRKKFPNQIIVRREVQLGVGVEAAALANVLQVYDTVESAMDAAVGVDIELAIYGLLETRTRRKA